MQKLSAQSKDLSQENIRKIEKIFPNCVTETYDQDGNLVRSIDFDILRQDLSDHVVEGPKERYQFNWPGKREAILLANAPTTNTLRPLPEKSVDFENTKNVYIEGDNLEALKILRETYMGKIKMIYIDPPYNTGNDFVYKDNFKQSTEEYLKSSGSVDEEGNRMEVNGESNGRFHSDWLNMMYPRLILARDLLTDDGVIFISIDDSEVDHLKNICDEIFGENNFISNIIWQSTGGSNTGSSIVTVTEYILLYGKNKNLTKIKLLEKNNDNYCERDEYFSKRGAFYYQKLDGKFTPSHYSPSLTYPLVFDDKTIWPGGGCEKSNELWNWRWSRTKVEWGLKNGFIVYLKDKNKNGVYFKNYELVDNEGNPRKPSVPPKNIIGTNIATTASGTSELHILFGNDYFPFPKSTKLIQYLINLIDINDGIVLDFFSGSATTASAVFQCNILSGYKLSFILVQLPEKTEVETEAFKNGYQTICDIGEERIRRVGTQVKESNPLTSQDLDAGFRVFKIDSSNMKDILSTPKETQLSLLENADSAIKADRNSLDLVTQIMLQLGITLDADIKIGKFARGGEFYAVNGNDLICCFKKNISESDIEEIAKMKPLNVAFRDDSFASDQDEVNCEQIFKTLSPITGKNIFVL